MSILPAEHSGSNAAQPARVAVTQSRQVKTLESSRDWRVGGWITKSRNKMYIVNCIDTGIGSKVLDAIVGSIVGSLSINDSSTHFAIVDSEATMHQELINLAIYGSSTLVRTM
jgi:hypothetical protein